MGQNKDTTERGDKQGQQGGQMDKSNQQDQQRQQQKSGMPDNNIADNKGKDQSANRGTSGGNQNR